MGKEARVTAILAEGEDAGRLQYEPPKLIFRGRARHVWAGEDLLGLKADGDDLFLRDGSRFRLGAVQAGRWAQAILNPPSRLDKLGVKPGLRIALSGHLDTGFLDELAAVAPLSVDAEEAPELVFLAVDSPVDLATLPALAAGLAPGGAVWIVTAKGRTAPVKDAEIRAAGQGAGLVDTKVCAFSDTHTALKFSRRRG